MSPSRDYSDIDLKSKILDETDDTRDFSCGKKELDDFIHKEALIFQNELYGVTYLFRDEGRLLGFVTLSMADLRRDKMGKEEQPPKGRENYPAIQISQLAVCKDLQSRKIGTALLLLSWKSCPILKGNRMQIPCSELQTRSHELLQEFRLQASQRPG